tara:strand:- start:191 stop:616 length:426 start_codon:yes stop_codon:yes gene_type:complete
MWYRKEIEIKTKKRGFHIITNEVLLKIPEIKNITIGILHLFLKHTSASLTINENADNTVRLDFENHFNILVPENQSYYQHTYEGSDDIPAHIKTSLLGSAISIPILDSQINLGTWQGIYLCEHRNNPHTRKIVATINGELK